MEVFIIGGGASGLTAAIKAKKNGVNVTILEKNNKCGKKILLSGNGRCNFWNEDQDLKHYHSTNKDLIDKIIINNNNKVLEYFDELGIVYKKINGYYYPYSNQSTSVLNALLNKVNALNIKIKYEENVIDIKKEDKFIITTEKNKYYADKVIISTGSKACPKSGSDGFGYKILKKLGHNINTILPSLTQIEGKDKFYKEWNGVRANVNLTLYENGIMKKTEFGEIQLCDYGISGICSFNLSGIISKGLNNNFHEEIFINFVPWFDDKENFIKWLDNQNKKLKGYNISQILEGFLNYKLVNLILKLAKIKKESLWEDIDKVKLANLITNFKFEVKNTKSFEHAQVCSGGVSLDEIDINTMESKIIKNLYIIGELLDVDGDCGGYNLGFAWISGIVAGSNI